MTIDIQVWDIDNVIPYERNVKVHDNAQIEKIANSISEFGFDQPIVVDKNGVIIKGHGRRLAALMLGLKKLPVVVRDDLTEDQVKASRLADNRVAQSDIDTTLLQDEIRKIDMELDLFFDEKELAFLNSELLDVEPIEDSKGILESQMQEFGDGYQTEGQYLDEIFGFKRLSEDQAPIVKKWFELIERQYGCCGAQALYGFANHYINESEK